MNKTKRVVFTSVAITIATVGVLNIIDSIYASTSANAATSGLSMSATITPSSTVTIGANAVNLDIVPSTSGTFKSNYVAVSAYTNTTNTCNVTMTTSSPDLTSGANTIPSLTSAASESDFSVNSWGYRAGSSGDYNPVATGEAANPVATLTSMTGSNAVTTNVYFAAKLNQAIKPGTYSNTVTFASTCPPPPAYMQDMTASSLAALMPNVGDTTTLADSRDGQEYTVAKFADGKYWMTKNLNIAGGTALSSNNTDVDSSYISSFTTSNNLTKTGSTIVLPASATTGFDTNNYSYVYNSGNITTSQSDCTSSKACNSYYSWDAATLGSGRSISTKNSNAPYSICPKGWRLPTTYDGGGTAAEATDFRALMIALGGSNSVQSYTSSTSPTGATIYSKLIASPYNFLIGGDYDNDTFMNGGSAGYYWSATSYSSSKFAYYFYFDSTSVYSATAINSYFGYSVRCVFGS